MVSLVRKVSTSNIKPGWGFPGGAGVKNLPAKTGDMGSSLNLGRFHMPQSN